MISPPVFRKGERLTADKLNALAYATRSRTEFLKIHGGDVSRSYSSVEPLLPPAVLAPYRITGTQIGDDDHGPGVYVFPGTALNSCYTSLSTAGGGEADRLGVCVVAPGSFDAGGTVYLNITTDPLARVTGTSITFGTPEHTENTLPEPLAATSGAFSIPIGDVTANPYTDNPEKRMHVRLRSLGDVRLPTLIFNEKATADNAAPGSVRARSAPLVKGYNGTAWTVRQLTEGGGITITIPNPEGDMTTEGSAPDDIILTSGHYHIGYNWTSNAAPGTPPTDSHADAEPFWKTIAVLNIRGAAPGTQPSDTPPSDNDTDASAPGTQPSDTPPTGEGSDAPGTPPSDTSENNATTQVKLQVYRATPWSTAYRFMPDTVTVTTTQASTTPHPLHGLSLANSGTLVDFADMSPSDFYKIGESPVYGRSAAQVIYPSATYARLAKSTATDGTTRNYLQLFTLVGDEDSSPSDLDAVVSTLEAPATLHT